jgi:hypothetical protein
LIHVKYVSFPMNSYEMDVCLIWIDFIWIPLNINLRTRRIHVTLKYLSSGSSSYQKGLRPFHINPVILQVKDSWLSASKFVLQFAYTVRVSTTEFCKMVMVLLSNPRICFPETLKNGELHGHRYGGGGLQRWHNLDSTTAVKCEKKVCIMSSLKFTYIVVLHVSSAANLVLEVVLFPLVL